MNDRQLESFVAACACGSLTKAAARACISVPAFAQQINLLEREVGFKLLERSPRGVTPTEAGQALEQAARSILDTWRGALERGHALDEHRRRTLRVACDPSSIPPFLAQICAEAQKADPAMGFSLVETPYASQVDAVAQGKADLCFFVHLKRLDSLAVTFYPLYREGFCACVPPGSALAGRESLRWEDLAGSTVYMEDVYLDEERIAAELARLRGAGIALRIDGTPYDAALPARVALEGGVLPCPASYLTGAVPPLVSVPMDMPASTYGIVRRAGELEGFDAFLATARGYFSTDANASPWPVGPGGRGGSSACPSGAGLWASCGTKPPK